jgi:hypothetical protein
VDACKNYIFSEALLLLHRIKVRVVPLLESWLSSFCVIARLFFLSFSVPWTFSQVRCSGSQVAWLLGFFPSFSMFLSLCTSVFFC